MKKADEYDNPKTVKMFEVSIVEDQTKKLFRAVTYLRTCIIGYQEKVNHSLVGDLMKKCEAHEHDQGIILEVGRLE